MDWQSEMLQRLTEYNNNTQNPADLESTEWLTQNLAPEDKLKIEDTIRRTNSGELGFFELEPIFKSLSPEAQRVMDIYMREMNRWTGQSKTKSPGIPLTS